MVDKENNNNNKSNDKVTKDMIISDIVKMGEEYQLVLLGFGMSCLGCPISTGETLEQGALAHDIDLEMLLDELNNIDEE